MSGIHDVIILGAGPAGLTAGLYAARARLGTLLLGERPGGSPVLYDQVENYPGFPGGVPGARLMMGMVQQVDELGVERRVENAERVRREDGAFRVEAGDDSYSARALIVATGSRPKRLGIAGEERFLGRGIFYCAHCDAPVFQKFQRAKAVVVGGGNSAVDTALFVTRYAEEVTLVHRGAELRADRAGQEAVRSHPKIRLLLAREVVDVVGDEGNVRAVTVEEPGTGNRDELPADGIFVGIGQEANSHIVCDLVPLAADGSIPVDERRGTPCAGLFAAGDVVQKPLRQIVTAAADGAVAADSVVQHLATARHRP